MDGPASDSTRRPAAPPRAAAAGDVGRVTLAGAGPGDPDLLTLKAARCIAEADAIVHDALVGDLIRARFPAGTPCYDVGKRAGSLRSTPQAETNALLVRLARQGLHVLRLKGGDPFIFGRGGEEVLHLRAHGIPCEIVPGISAANGAAAAAAIPLTHRETSRACTLLSGFGPHLDGIDWPALVALGGTWVFFMGTRSLADIAARLLAHGADAGLRVALVESATLPGQRTTVRSLRAAAAGALVPRGDDPGLVLIGPAVGLMAGLMDGPARVEADWLAALAVTPLPGAPCAERSYQGPTP